MYTARVVSKQKGKARGYRWNRWTPEMDSTLRRLVKRHPKGTQRISWTEVLNDKEWTYGPMRNAVLRNRYRHLNEEYDQSLTPQQYSKPDPKPAQDAQAQVAALTALLMEALLKYCPDCGSHLEPTQRMRLALAQTNQAITNGR